MTDHLLPCTRCNGSGSEPVTSPEPLPPQAVTDEIAAFHAVANVIHQRYCNHRKKGRSCSGPTNGERAVARDALEAAAPHLAAAERERRAASLIGYRIGGQIYHPEDVTIVYREQP